MNVDITESASGLDMAEWKERADQHVLHALRSDSGVVLKAAKGVRIWDVDGKEYLDGISGTQGTAMVGHSHPAVVAAVSAQLETLATNYFAFDSDVLINFAMELAALAPGELTRVHTTVGGGEAIEAAVKLAIRATGKPEVISLYDAYHGLSLGTLGLAGVAGFRAWAPGVMRWPTFSQVPSGDPYRPKLDPDPAENARAAARALRAALGGAGSTKLAAVVMELVQGPGGHIVQPKEFVTEVADITREAGAKLIIDEIQTGFGRCGSMWACEQYGIEPDILVVGKALGGGIPIGALMAKEELVGPELEKQGWNVLTFMNQPLQAAAGTAVLGVIEEEGLVARSQELGDRARARFEELAGELEVIGDVRGLGLFLGLDLVTDRETKEPAAAATQAAIEWALENGLITGVGGSGKNVLKFKPPLTTLDAEFEQMLELMSGALREAEKVRREGNG